MKRFLLILAFAIPFAAHLCAQSDNSIHVKEFPGNDVGTKTANAMATCPATPRAPCILVIDASLAGFAPGTLPTLCSNCYIQDFRSGPPAPLTLMLNVHAFGAMGIGTDDETAAVQAAVNAACPLAALPNATVELYVPAGVYPIHGIKLKCAVLIEGAGVVATRFEYNGAQNTGTYPNVIPSSAAYLFSVLHNLSFGGFEHLSLLGSTSAQTVRSVATELLRIGSADSQLNLRDVQFANSIGDAIHLISLVPAYAAPIGTSGYVTASGVSTTGGTGSGMMVNIKASGGRVTAVTIASPDMR